MKYNYKLKYGKTSLEKILIKMIKGKKQWYLKQDYI